jgi:AcrR family transcriptional regulator
VTAESAPPARRRYDNTLRQARSAETRERIIDAATRLLRDSTVRGWAAVTVRAVAERADVHERTIYRHFPSEQALHDAVLHRFEEEYGIDLAQMEVDDIGDVATRIFRSLASYAVKPARPLDPALEEAKRRQHGALLKAVTERTADWPEPDRVIAAAAFDLLWSVPAYDRFVLGWELEFDDAVRAATWVIGLVQEAVEGGRRPWQVDSSNHDTNNG